MEKYAVLSAASVTPNCLVENVIALDAGQVAEMEVALGKAIIPAGELGLQIGDLYNGANWTRNVDGVQTVLPLDVDDPAVEAMLAILEGRA